MITFPDLEHAGRLGNQLHQVAATIGLARTHGDDPAFPATWSYAPYFSLPESFYVKDLAGGTPAAQFATHLDPRCRAYLQDYSLWRHAADEVRAVFRCSSYAWAVLVAAHPHLDLERLRASISIHVRRGDYLVHQDAYWVPTLPYFAVALATLPSDAPVTVFSDDLPWCRAELPALLRGRDTVYFPGVTRPKAHEPEYATAPVFDWIDLVLQTQCRWHVISNSTYSWWGAWLSRNRAPCYPGQWYGPAIRYADPSRMMPDGWIRIDSE